MKTLKLIRTILMFYHLQQVNIKNIKINPHLHATKIDKDLERGLGLSVIDQLNMMNESEKVILNIGGMPVNIYVIFIKYLILFMFFF